MPDQFVEDIPAGAPLCWLNGAYIKEMQQGPIRQKVFHGPVVVFTDAVVFIEPPTSERLMSAAKVLGTSLAMGHSLDGLGFGMTARAIVGGDATEPAISAASILAKTARDQYMDRMAALYPKYAFANHKGYGTEEHCRLLALHGPCPLHRRSFAPVKALLLERSAEP